MKMNSKCFQAAIENDKAASFWLKKSISGLEQRDPLDAINDVEALLEFCKLRLEETTTVTA